MDNYIGISSIKKEICMQEFMVHEYPGIILKFIPDGTLQIFGEDKAKPIKHTYSIFHNGNIFYLETSPSILEEPSKMILKVMKNHITLEGNKEILHLSKLKLKIY